MSPNETQPTCFIAMPITTHEHEAKRYSGDSAHWVHVMETVHVKAIEAAGFTAIRPVTVGSHMIHGEIIRQLASADMVLCDLSGHNPNVFFELSVRTSLNLPICLVRDEFTEIPFDTSGLNTHAYSSTLHAWDLADEISSLATHIEKSVASCSGQNPMWRYYGLTIDAEKPESPASPSDAKLELMYEWVAEMRSQSLRDQRLRYPAVRDEASESQTVETKVADALGSNAWRTNTLSHGEMHLHYATTIPLNDVFRRKVIEAAVSSGYDVHAMTQENESVSVILHPQPLV